MRKAISFTLMLTLMAAPCLAAPVLLFQDLTSGPKTGLTDASVTNQGAIVTVWGTGLGATQGASTVTCGGAAVAHVYYWGPDDGSNGPTNLAASHGMQSVSFAVSSSASDGVGTISVTVAGTTSNTLPFTVRSGNIYFVATNGTGSGTWEDPMSATSFVTKMDSSGGNEKGIIGYFRAGTYSGNYAYSGASHTNFCLRSNHSGTGGNENAFVGYPGELTIIATGGAVDRGNFTATYTTGSEGKYFIVSKLSLIAYQQSVNSHAYWRVIGNRIDSIDVLTGSGCIGVGGYQDDTATGVYLYGNEIAGGSSGNKLDHAIYPGAGTDNLYIGWNYIHDNNFAEGPQISVNCNAAWVEGLTSTNVHIFSNVIDMSAYPSRAIGAFETGEGSTIFVYNNIVIGLTYNSSPAIYAMSGNVAYYNNTLYNVGTGNMDAAFSFYCSTTGGHYYCPESIVMRNNVVYANSNLSYYIRTTNDSPVPTNTHNLWYGIGTFSGNSACVTNCGTNANAVEADPQFTNAATGNFSLQSGSPAVGAGYDMSALFTQDAVGMARGALFDMGAVEYESTPTTLSLLSPSGAQSCTDDPRNVTESLTTSEAATCRAHDTETAWASMTEMTTTGGTSHGRTVSRACGGSYSPNVLCRDADANESAMSEWAYSVAPIMRSKGVRFKVNPN